MARTLRYDMKVRKNGDVWRILGLGVSKGNATLCHLASTTRFRAQRNGNNPIQQQDWVKGLPTQPKFIG
ncbi:hypothetical protein amad1_21508 (plasmid) [Alteromonas mediterranea DE1]|uniref:Uncharacterized protein n=1 Tax=Alteromonas mediterranea TaxID=314275 RepID=A0AAC8XNX0_9ALTE|nr:hypothetical protein [Alteromonas macleodii]AFV87735.1 hypothetical protein amad1_21508 [Alteromonas mediterranea DE1]AGP87775.1 hypothetical protein I607_20222 [Alteromonas mediterranea U4]AGP99757.1 hypothetical protein I635_21514 [Alteromonas mediterranea UM7]AMJ80855.1 hypothetical protein AV942_20980 [Alteromonas mediterranea]CAH1194642.1 hypothetical protein ISS312_02406 [Alteromonas mediterranea]